MRLRLQTLRCPIELGPAKKKRTMEDEETVNVDIDIFCIQYGVTGFIYKAAFHSPQLPVTPTMGLLLHITRSYWQPHESVYSLQLRKLCLSQRMNQLNITIAKKERLFTNIFAHLSI